MPWKAVGKNIVRADTGKVVGHSKDNATAKAAVRARYANAGLEAASPQPSFAQRGAGMLQKKGMK